MTSCSCATSRQAMDLPPETFGLVAEPGDWPATGTPSGDEAHEWRLVRQTLNRHRAELTAVAADLYWDPIRIAGTTCITQPGWMPAEPLPFSAIELSWREHAEPPMVVGSEPASAPYRPHSPSGERYSRYSQAIRAIAAPSLFENRASYRLLDLDWSSAGGQMSYGFTTYFDMVDVCEPLAHEVALAWLRRRESGERVSVADLPFREHIGDLFDLARRPVLPSINTLTIRRAPRGRLVLPAPSRFLARHARGRLVACDSSWRLPTIRHRAMEHGRRLRPVAQRAARVL